MAVSKNILLDSTGQDIIEGLDDIATAIVEHTPESIIDDTTTSTSSTWSSYKINDELDDKLDVPAVPGTNGQFLGLENNLPNWKNISDAIISDAETSTSKVWSSGKVNTELSSINQAIGTLPTSETGAEWANKEELNTELVDQFVSEVDRMFSIGLPQESTMGRVITQLALGNGLLNDLYLGMEVS